MSILNYTNTILEPLRELMLQEKVADIPDIKLRPDTDIHLIASHISTSAFVQNASSSTKQKTTATFDTIIDFFEDDNNITRTQSTDKIAKALGGILENSHNTIINEIGSMVTDLRANIEEYYLRFLKLEKADDLFESEASITEKDYTFLKWEKLRTASRQLEIVENACSNINLNNRDLLSTNLTYITEKLRFSGMVDADISSEATTTILTELNKVFTSESYGISTQRIERLLSVATSKQAYSTFCAAIQSQMNSHQEVASNTIFLIQLVNDFNTVMGRINTILTDHVSGSTLSVIKANLTIVQKTLVAIQYFCLYNKEKRFKNRLILTKTIINNEVYQEFLKSGKSIVDIHNYLKVFHQKVSVPLMGIDVDIVNDANLEERLAVTTATNRSNAKFIKSKCLIQAYDLAMNEFAKQIMEENLFDYEDDRSIIAKFSAIAKVKAADFGGDIGKVDDALYDVLIKTFYDDDLVGVVFKYLRYSIMDLSKSTEAITDQSILDAEAKSAVFILTDFLYDKLTIHTDVFKGSSPHE